MLFRDYDEIVQEAKKFAPVTVAVAGADDSAVMEALKRAELEGLAKPILIGVKSEILRIAEELDYKICHDSVIDASSPDECAYEAVRAAAEERAGIVMKGRIQTSVLMKAVFNKEKGLRTGRIISHVFFIKLPGYKFVGLTDGGINIAPELPEQAAIIQNAADFCHLMGLAMPKVAVLAPVETVSEKMPSTLYGAVLSKMADRGQIKGALVDGPLAFDNALLPESVKEKGIVSDVAGDADILFVSDIDMGNGLFKGLVHFGKGIPAAVILGAKTPIIVTSRADSSECKFYSIALNVLYAGKLKKAGEI